MSVLTLAFASYLDIDIRRNICQLCRALLHVHRRRLGKLARLRLARPARQVQRQPQLLLRPRIPPRR